VLIPIPDRDFDPTEVAVSWQVLTNHGHSVVFATESGSPATADDIMLTGRGLDIWSAVPLLGRAALIGRFLRANRDALDAYAHMVRSPEYQHPFRWTAATIDDVDAVLLPGGHRARGMRGYIDSETLHRLVVEAFTRGLVVAAICHGVLLAARSVDPAADPIHPVPGPRLLPHLHRRAGPTDRLHVGAVRGHPRLGQSRRLLRCCSWLARLADKDIGIGPRQRD